MHHCHHSDKIKIKRFLKEGDSMDKISIGKMALLNQVTEQTLRHYDKFGLLKPAYIDEKSKYRYYDIKQSAKLDMIQHMKALGMSLKQIKEQFDREDIESIRQVLSHQKKCIDQKTRELNNMKMAVEASIQNYDRYLNKPPYNQIFLEHIQERKIFCYDVKTDVYRCNLDDYEYILRELKKQATLQHLPMAYFCNVGSIIRKKKLHENSFESSEIFLFVPNDFESPEGTEYIQEDNFLCIYCDSFEQEKECADQLRTYISNHDYEITGDYICEVVIELPIFYHNERHLHIKIQIPIKTN